MSVSLPILDVWLVVVIYDVLIVFLVIGIDCICILDKLVRKQLSMY